MPGHRGPRARLPADITSSEREREMIGQVLTVPDEPSVVEVYTRWIGQPIPEYRSAGGAQ
jgi:hypothetical protein